MRKKAIGILICFLLISTVFPVMGIVINENEKSKTGYNLLEGGWLEEIDGVKVLYVSGSNYEMGYQHGSLLKEECQQNLRAMLDYSDSSYEDLLAIWNVMKDYIPQRYIDEIQGIADGAEVSFEDVVVAYMVIVEGDMGCFGISAWGSATKDGRLYHTRSFDQPMDIQDPISGKFAHENSVLIVRNPADGYASLCPSVAGAMHGGGGINEQGISIGQQVCWSKDYTFEGIPAQYRTQMVLDHAASADEAIDILTTNKTLGWNFVLSDAKIPIGYVVEATGSDSYVGTYNDPTETNGPFWEIDHVVRRTNFFIDPDIAATQRDNYDPSGVLSFIKLVMRTDIFFAVWKSYQVMSKDIERHWGSMDIDSTMCMFRKGYHGKTNFLLYLIVKLAEGTSFNRSWNIWVADPNSGDIAVSFATRDKIAFQTTVHHFNLYDLLNQ